MRRSEVEGGRWFWVGGGPRKSLELDRAALEASCGEFEGSGVDGERFSKGAPWSHPGHEEWGE